MKKPIFLLCLMLPGPLFASVQAMFLPIPMVVLTIHVPTGGAADNDNQVLWDDMLVEIQNPDGNGPGKSIVSSPGTELKFVCGQRQGTNLCTIVLNAQNAGGTRWVDIDRTRSTARFHAEGAEADAFTSKFKGPFLSSDQKLRIFSEAGHFEIQYSAHGFSNSN